MSWAASRAAAAAAWTRGVRTRRREAFFAKALDEQVPIFERALAEALDEEGDGGQYDRALDRYDAR